MKKWRKSSFYLSDKGFKGVLVWVGDFIFVGIFKNGFLYNILPITGSYQRLSHLTQIRVNKKRKMASLKIASENEPNPCV